jgi:c-di-GMP-binding flagellar brake protein YcgR
MIKMAVSKCANLKLMQQEKRTFRRIAVEHSIRIVEADGSILPAIAVDVSLTGMQILCDEPTMNRVTLHGIQTSASDGVRIHVRVSLPDLADNSGRLGLFGRVVAVREGSKDEYRLGVQFTDFEPGTYHALETYIDSHL